MSYWFKAQRELKQEWIEKNEKAKLKGSVYHQKQEDKLNYNKYRIIEGGFIRPLADITGLNLPISHGDKLNLCRDLPDGVYSELLVKNHPLQMSGQVDYSFIETINGVRYVDIDDYKTNEKLTFENKYQNFQAPIDFVPQHKFNIYRIQILLYAWMFEQYGFVVRNLTLTYHPTPSVAPIVYRIHRFSEYDKDPIKLMLETRKNYLLSL